MTDRSLLFIETNCGGPDPGMHSLLQVGLGIEQGDGERTLDSFFIREPDIRIDPRANRIHGITAYSCDQNGIEPRAAARRILDFMGTHLDPEGASLCGWNIGIDRSFLRRLFRLAGDGDWLMRFERVLGFRSFDLQSALRFLCLHGFARPFNNFAEACEQMGVMNDRPHDAMSDTIACMDLLRAMRNIVPSSGTDRSVDARLSSIEADEDAGKINLGFSMDRDDAGAMFPLLGRAVRLSIHAGVQHETAG